MKLPQLTLRDLFWLVLVFFVFGLINLPTNHGKGYWTAGFPIPFATWWAGTRTFSFVAFFLDALIGGALLNVLAAALPWSRRRHLKPISQPMPDNPHQPPKDDGRQEFFWWQLSEPWWSLAVAVTISSLYFGGGMALMYLSCELAMRFGPFGD